MIREPIDKFDYSRKVGLIAATLAMTACYLVAAALLWAIDLRPAAVTTAIGASLCCPAVIWYIWRNG